MRNFTLIVSFVLLSVISWAQNKKPVLLGPQVKQTCAGTQACFSFTTNDGDNDTITVFWDHSIADGVFSNNNNTVLFANGSVCWIPKNADARDTPHVFTVYATDKKDTVSRQFSLYVRPTPTLNPVIKNIGCNNFSIHIQNDTAGVFDIISNTVQVKDLANNIVYTSSDNDDTVALKPGTHTYVFYTIISTGFSCYAQHYDTIRTHRGAGIKITADKDLSMQVKEWSELNLSAIITDSNGFNSFQYNWLPDGQTTQAIKVFPTKNTIYRLTVKTPDTCESTDTVNVNVLLTGIDNVAAQQIKVYPNPAVSYINIEKPDESIATAEIWSITGQKIMHYELVEKTNAVSISEIKPGNYFLIFIDKNGKSVAVKSIIKE